jgi:DUF971 family protein
MSDILLVYPSPCPPESPTSDATATMNKVPTKLELTGEDRLRITWSDAEVREYTFRELRDKCPCATCREKRNAPPPPPTQLPVLTEAQTRPLKITGMKPVGNYAYSIDFSDGHDTGIYTIESLREMGDVITA